MPELALGTRMDAMRTARSRPATVAAATLVLLGTGILPATARPVPTGPSTSMDVTTANVADYLDATVPDLLEEHSIPGAAISVVSGGQTVFSRGYGVADVASGKPVDAATTQLRVGSITKLFTATAVMQQVEAGRLDLDTDVNRYLTGFQVPDTFDQPITLRHLLTHTAGFEDTSVGTYARTADDVQPLGEFLAAHMPARIRPPGQVVGYSNYGAGLAGYIVSQVSGQSYEDDVREHVLDPLGMTHSSVASTFSADLATSYDSTTDPVTPVERMYDQTTPDGALNATADDMAQFMLAHLEGGSTARGTILSPETTALMHQQAFTATAGFDGMALGFIEGEQNGHRVLWHDGGEEGFVSYLMLVPDADLGIFFSFNAYGGAETGALLDGFVERFLPEQTPPRPASSAVGPLTVTQPTAGFYLSARHNESSVEKVTNLFSASRLRVATDGTVTFKGAEWAPQPDGTFLDGSSNRRMVFLTDGTGHEYATISGGVSAYQLVPTTDTVPFTLLVLLVILLPALGLVVLPTTALVRRRRGHPAARLTGRWRAARWLAVGAAVLAVAFLAGMLTILMGDTQAYYYGPPAAFLALLAVPVVALLCGGTSMVLTAVAWRGSGAGVMARIHQVTLFASLAAFTWFVVHWNLLGWQLV